MLSKLTSSNQLVLYTHPIGTPVLNIGRSDLRLYCADFGTLTLIRPFGQQYGEREGEKISQRPPRPRKLR